MGFLDRGVVPEGVREFKDPNPQEAFGRFGPNDPPPGWGEGVRQYTPEAQIAANARQALTQKMEPKPQRDFEGELATKIRATSERDRIRYAEANRQDKIDQINKQIDGLLKERASTMPLEKGAENSWGFDYSDAEREANPANVKYALLGEQIKKLQADRDALGAVGGAAGALGAPSQVAPSNTGNIEDDIANGAPSFKP
jgi:hypothetical protein